MTAETDSITFAEFAAAAETVGPGDAVAFATTYHEYKTPLSVREADVTTWQNPRGDWRTVVIVLESAHGKRIELVGIEGARSPRWIDGPTVRKIVRIEPTSPEGAQDCPDCGETFDSRAALNGHRVNPFTDCGEPDGDRAAASDADDDTESDGGTRATEPTAPRSWDAEGFYTGERPGSLRGLRFAVPDHVDEDALRAAAAEYDTIEAVADALEWPNTGRVRAALFRLDLYDDLKRPEAHRKPGSKTPTHWGGV